MKNLSGGSCGETMREKIGKTGKMVMNLNLTTRNYGMYVVTSFKTKDLKKITDWKFLV